MSEEPQPTPIHTRPVRGGGRMSFELKRQLMKCGFVIGTSLTLLVDNLWIQVPALALGTYVVFQYGRALGRTERNSK